ncbi:PQQ-binding-like beta-propeller repeat protein [Prosthecobacter sp.]|uniref:outer membrane protein assembly factor BamB family protein n=1 Tax=Prosthecobacter sp. TaxID=1965333 RepID=UPI001DE9DBED|nr:PQQ-binding-like beta-propeller repeat protein [Prosthecobacter sp.]MCB1274947.1 PQQ-binding-like beta-propeller repeat protein [Prosthecobacter sp.]
MKRFLFSLLFSSALLADDAADLISQSGVKGGIVVHVGCGDGKLTQALRANERYQVQGLTKDAAAVPGIRESIHEAGKYGPVAVESWDGKHLPYIENYVNLLVIEDASAVAKEEIDRVLTPLGVAMVKKVGGGWDKITKPWPKGMDEWTHYAYDSEGNPTSKDLLVGPPSRMQWVGNPRWSRHHDRMSSVSAQVSAGGRIFYIMDEGSRISILMPAKFALIARDAFNGTILWKKPIPEWSTHLWPLKSGPTQLTRRLVAVGDKVYVTLGIADPISCLDAATGEEIRKYPQTKRAEEILYRNGTIYTLVNPEPWVLNEEFAVKQQSDQKRVETEFNWDGKTRHLMAIDADSGKTVWKVDDKVGPITIALDDKRIVYYNGDGLTSRDVKTGEVKFADVPEARRKLYEFNFAPRVVLNKDIILYAGGDGLMKGINADTGKELWSSSHEKSGYRSMEDVIVAQGLVWNAGTTSGNQTGEYTGRDPLTGEVKKQFYPDVPEGTYWFHHRCYMAKATEKYIMPSRTGIEYVDMEKQHWDLNHWVRGACLYGVMPCNGLTYAGPHNCACYPEAKLDGMSVMASAPRYPMPENTPDNARLTKGPAYADAIDEKPADAKDWPTYRSDNARSGFSDQDLKKDLGMAWEVKLTPPLSTTTSAAGLTFVSEVDKHTLHAFDSATGKEAWHFIAGGRMDSPPTYWQGRVYVGGNDGNVYCLRAKDGALVWKFQGAPVMLSHGAWEMMESVWPVHGSVLVENGLVSFVAGHSCFLDDGLWFYRVDAKTGEMKVKTHYDDRDPDTGGDLNDRHKTLQMPVALNDILSSDGKWTYLRTQKIDPKGVRVEVGPVSGDFDKQGGAHKGEGQHLFAPMGFLDDSNFHRSYWVYGKSFAGGHGGYFQAGKYAPAGRILVHDDKNVYSYGREAQYYKWTTTMEYTLFSTPKAPPEQAFDTESATTERRGNSVVLGADGRPLAEQPKNKETQVGHSETLKQQAEAKKKAGKGKAKGAAKGDAKPKNAPIPGSVQFPDVAALDPTGTPITVEAWVLPDTANGTILNQGGPRVGVGLDFHDKKPQFHIRSDSKVSTISSAEAMTEGWHHLVGTLAADKKMSLYIDGKLVAEGTAGGLVSSKPANPLIVGNGNGVAETNAGGYSGLLDQFAIYHKALSAAEVQQRFEQPESKPTDAVLACNFDNGDSRDNSGNEAHGVGAGVESGKGKVGGALWFKGGAAAGAKAGSFVKHTWDRFVPIVARSMALAGKTVLVSGAPDTIDEEYAFERLAAKDPEILKELKEQDEALDGKHGAKMWAVNVETGEQSSGLELTSPPVWDGITVAQGRVYVSTMDGRLQCFGK